jgi:hypothetical protein
MIFEQKCAFPDFRDVVLRHILRGPLWEMNGLNFIPKCKNSHTERHGCFLRMISNLEFQILIRNKLIIITLKFEIKLTVDFSLSKLLSLPFF